MSSMKMMHRIAIWEAAKSEPNGILLQLSDVQACKMALYQARIKANDPSLADLEIRSPKGKLAEEGNLVIVHAPKAPKLAVNNFGNIDLQGVLDLALDDE